MALIVDDFWSIYKNEWREARQALRQERNEEEIIYLLMRIVRVSYLSASLTNIYSLEYFM